MKFRFVQPLIAALLFLPMLASGQVIDDNAAVRFNPNITTGTLSNGIPYYILHNEKPKNRMDIVLVVNAGAVLEDDNQNGFAHFCEHMAFNGTESFPKNELIGFLESTGVRFGADLNAYTNQDETVYLLTLPSDDDEVVDNGIKVIRDWAGYVTYERKDIDEERGVVVEEWRTRTGAEQRVREFHNKSLYGNSPYARRDVIGDTAVLLHSDAENARRFYKTWYGPQNMSIIAVGDFDVEAFEARLKELFVLPSDLASRTQKRPTITLPSHEETRISIASDKDLERPNVSMYIKGPADTVRTYGEYRNNIARQLASQMINVRLGELVQGAKPPFASAFVGQGNLVRETRAVIAQATASGKNILVAFNALMTEIERVRRHGFVETELERAKEQLMSNMQSYYNSRETTPSSGLSRELVRHVTTQEQVPGVEHEFEIYQHYVPMVTVEECGEAIRSDMKEDNRVFTFSVPEGNGYIKPTEKQVRGLLSAVLEKDIAAYVDNVPTEPLMASAPQPGSIVKAETIDQIGGQKLTLSNGATVYLKKTDFSDDEILFSAHSWGGQAMGTAADHYTQSNAAEIVDASGLAQFGPTELQKVLNGTTLGISPYIALNAHGFRGQTSPKDLKTFMELVHLYFTSPRIDEDAVASWKTRMEASLAQRDKNAQAALIDTLRAVMGQNHPQIKSTLVDDLSKIDPAKALAFYKMLFAGADDFSFTFVGNFDEAEMEDYVKTYIASLPVTSGKMKYKDLGIRTPVGSVSRDVFKGEDPRSFVVMAITGETPYNPKTRFEARALSEVMTMRLREQIREEKGGVYSIAAQASLEQKPVERYSLVVYFGCDPERSDELVAAVKQEVSFLQENAVDESYVQKIKEIMAKEYEVGIATNRFWLSSISQVDETGESWDIIAQNEKMIADLSVSTLLGAAKKYLNTDNVALFVQRPEKK